MQSPFRKKQQEFIAAGSFAESFCVKVINSRQGSLLLTHLVKTWPVKALCGREWAQKYACQAKLNP